MARIRSWRARPVSERLLEVLLIYRSPRGPRRPGISTHRSKTPPSQGNGESFKVRKHAIVLLIALAVACYAGLRPFERPAGADMSLAPADSGLTNVVVTTSTTVEASKGPALDNARLSGAAVSSPSISNPGHVTPPEDMEEVNERIRALNSGSSVGRSQVVALGPPMPAPSSDQCQPVNELYCIYTVQTGDTLSGIAHLLGLRGTTELSAAELLAQSNKPNVTDTDGIVPGQKLRVPRQSGIIHTVITTESLSAIAQAYGVSTTTIQAANSISNADALAAGRDIIIPAPDKAPNTVTASPPVSAVRLPSATPAASATQQEEPARTLLVAPEVEPPVTTARSAPETTPTPRPTRTPRTESTATATAMPQEEPARTLLVTKEEEAPVTTANSAPETTPTPRPTRTPRTESTATPSATESAVETATATATATPSRVSGNSSGAGFIWPASGPISSYFGPAHPLGIDIDFYANPNQPVAAAAGGTVTFAGGDRCCSYGLYVIVDHGNGFTTLYAHLSVLSVSTGQRVSQGQQLGLGGRTGYATGNHLHFEVHLNGSVVNPLSYLP